MENKVIKHVIVEGLVLMKIIKHCQEEVVTNAFSTDAVHGVLVGLSQNDVLEITNCFPIPKTNLEDLDNAAEYAADNNTQYVQDVVRLYRQVNLDYLMAGFYQSSFSFQTLTRANLDALFGYKDMVNEAIMLMYDPSKAAQGQVCLRAFTTTPEINEIYNLSKEGKKAQIDAKYAALLQDGNSIFQEIPLSIRNSHLINTLIGDLDKNLRRDEHSFAGLDLGVSTALERQMKMMFESLDSVVQHCQIQAAFQKKAAAGPAALASGRDPTRNLTLPNALDTGLLASQLSSYSDDFSSLCDQTLGKLRLVHELHKTFQK